MGEINEIYFQSWGMEWNLHSTSIDNTIVSIISIKSNLTNPPNCEGEHKQPIEQSKLSVAQMVRFLMVEPT
jgi:hypothetical protein